MKLADGSFDEKKDFRDRNWAVHATPAVRDATGRALTRVPVRPEHITHGS